MREILFGLFRLINDFKEKDLGEFSDVMSQFFTPENQLGSKPRNL